MTPEDQVILAQVAYRFGIARADLDWVLRAPVVWVHTIAQADARDSMLNYEMALTRHPDRSLWAGTQVLGFRGKRSALMKKSRGK